MEGKKTMIKNIILVIGEQSAGKSHLCNLLPKNETRRFSNLNTKDLIDKIRECKEAGIKNIVLINSITNSRANAALIASRFAAHFEHVYVQIYPEDADTMVWLLTPHDFTQVQTQ